MGQLSGQLREGRAGSLHPKAEEERGQERGGSHHDPAIQPQAPPSTPGQGWGAALAILAQVNPFPKCPNSPR